MSQSPPSTDSSPRGPSRLLIRPVGITLSLTLLIVSLALWWRTSHTDHNGQIPTPTFAVRHPGGFLQWVAQRDGLHCIWMRDAYSSSSLVIQFDRMTYLGNAGYHSGTIGSYGGFTLAMLTRTLHDGDSITSPFAAIACPYWFLAAAGVCGLLFFLRKPRAAPTTTGPSTT